ncbi:MAG: DUF4387 domain-containing protein [Acidimicrobiia bacterium]
MTKLHEIASLIRSKNAGPFEVTFDVMFDDEASYRRVVDAKVLNVEALSQLFATAPDDVHLVEYPPGLAVKFTIPRKISGGDLGDTDVVGCQLYGPLVDLEVA